MDKSFNFERKFEIGRLGLAKGSELSSREIQIFANFLKFTPEEKLELLCDSEKFLFEVKLKDRIWIGVTSHRIFKVEKGEVTQQTIQNIKSITHQRNGIFYWDKLLITNNDNEVISFGIYLGEVCEIMRAHLEAKVRDIHTHKIIPSQVSDRFPIDNKQTTNFLHVEGLGAEELELYADNNEMFVYVETSEQPGSADEKLVTDSECRASPTRVSEKFILPTCFILPTPSAPIQRLYALRCRQNKYYVGRTELTVEERFVIHLTGKGSEFTKKYEPLEIVDQKEVIGNVQQTRFFEDAWVKSYMSKYGLNNVRGGSYSQLRDLTPEEVKFITREMNGATDMCFSCGEPGHFIKRCPSKSKPITFTTPDKKSSKMLKCMAIVKSGPRQGKVCGNDPLIDMIFCCFHQKAGKMSCTKCGRNNHQIGNCNAKVHRNGSFID